MEELAKEVEEKLFITAEYGNLCKVEKCLSMGANVLARNDHCTVLHSAVLSNNGTVVKLILDKMKERTLENVSQYIDAKDSNGDTPLMWAAKNGYTNSAKVLLEYGVDIEAKNNNGMTALLWTVKNSHVELMKLLLDKGANIYAKDNNGLTTFDHARIESDLGVSGYLAFYASEMFRKQGNFEDACEIYKNALDMQKLLLGHYHLDVLITRHNMAIALANLGNYSEALRIYQEVLDIQKRRDVLGPDHPGTLITLYNMAATFSDKGDNSEVLRIFREVLNIKGATSDFDHLIPLTISEIQKKESSIKSSSSKEGDYKPETNLDITRVDKDSEFVDLSDEVTAKDSESSVCSRTEDYQEDKELDECFQLKCDDLETIKKITREHFEDRLTYVFTLRGKVKGRDVWSIVFIDQGKKEKYLEELEKDHVYIHLYGKVLFSGFGKNPSQSLMDTVNEFINKKPSYELFVIKEAYENMSLYHYVLIDPGKRKMFLEQSITGLALARKIENCGRVLHSGLGQDPPEIISDRLVEAYFSAINKELEEIPAKLCVCSADRNGWTILHDAAYVGDWQVVRNLIDNGADLHAKDTVCGRFPVHIAAREGHEDIVNLFLKKTKDAHVSDEKKWSLLHYAAWSGHLGTVKLLLNKGAYIDAKEATHGKKPIHISSERGYMSIVNVFLRLGANVNDTDNEGRTPLYYATWRGHLEVVKNLIDRGANITAEKDDGTKPIHIATRSGYKNVIEYLLDRGANVNDFDKKCRTPLHIAAEDGNLEIAMFLKDKGANILLRNYKDKTASDCAREYGHMKVANFLDGIK